MTTKSTNRTTKKPPVEKPVSKAKKVVEEFVELEEGTPVDTFLTHQRKAIGEAGKALESLLPAGVREHGEAAFKEMIESYRALFNGTIDGIIDRMEKMKLTEEEKVETVVESEVGKEEAPHV